MLVGTLVTALGSVQKDSRDTSSLLQANVYYGNIVNIFRKFKDKDKELLFSTLYQAPIPFSTEEENFFMTVGCRPLANGANINWLGLENDTKMIPNYDITRKIFDSITAMYNLSDPVMLEEMLLEEIGKEGEFEHKFHSRLLQKRGIISYQQFAHIIDRYQLEADDPVVSSIPWDKYFSFTTESNVTDGNYMSAEAVAAIFDMELSAVEEEWVPGTDALQTFKQTYQPVDFEKYSPAFSKHFVDIAECEVIYTYADEPYKFTFMYSKGEVKHFEFLGRQ
ncbi:hypothetical protein PGH07_10575 [Sulfurovum sp. zt1-1]|uniref:Uncharacterized protein n=1 Tax=Sulfurovum zhangzhouensis TaxID=3019067 RepID=A0ABT7R0J8_9BACT|nr:hypothetical protein [Sulfurovum zhangzhouensis]